MPLFTVMSCWKPALSNLFLLFSSECVIWVKSRMNIADLLLALLANFAWGFNFIAGKVGVSHFQPLFFTALRFLFLLVIMLPWLRPAPGLMIPLLRVAFLLGVCHFSMMFIGLNAGGNVASVAITTQLYVPFSAVLAAVFLKEKVSAFRATAIGVALLGVLAIGFDPVVFNHLDAMLWVGGAAFMMASATVMMRRFPNLGVFKLQAWIALIATPSLLFLSLLFESGHMQLIADSQLKDYWSPLYSAVGASVIGHGIVYSLLGRYPVSIVTPLMLLAPVLASVFGILLLNDEIGWKLVIGGVMTLVGVMMVSVHPEYIMRLLGRNSSLVKNKLP